MDSYVGWGNPEEKLKLFQVELCLVSPRALHSGCAGGAAENLDILDMRRTFLIEHLAQVEHEMLLK